MLAKHSAKITFFYLLSLFGLVFTALMSGMIVFQIINKFIPEAINYSSYFSAEQLRFAISAVIIATPVYYWMTFLIQKSLKSEELSKESQLRKWMTYIIIFVASIVIIVSLIGIINNYLSGALTSKIALKILTTILISGTVLSYYLYDLKRTNFEKNVVVKIYFWSSLFFVLVVLVAGFLVTDSPAQVRKMKHDSQIVRSFDRARYAIEDYVRENKTLPKKISDMDNFLMSDNRFKIGDFEYKVVNQNTYELCADFETNNKDNSSLVNRYIEKEWLHDRGHQCFQKTINLNNIIKGIESSDSPNQ